MRFSSVLVGARRRPRCHFSLGGPAGTAPAYGNEDQAKVGHPVQQPVQSGLVRHRAGDDRVAVIAGDLQALEPGRPSLAAFAG